ncbi:LOW QUALITY PROTEIN: epiplakin [Anoplopoma fimbria]|uniref:LOW QUALITY PROTEIN: epiplakin n=1 Tax=Anoplopoma fimbria TaxID=229290 RepID=UPI0023EB313C|nr:LOW QUALITY PROTEIN: epiplakin [Anoplopoma fimbria]
MDSKQNGHTEVHGPVAGVFLEKTKEKITIYQAMKKRLLKAGTALALLEAQAATVGIVDPINNRILPVADAVKEGIVGPEMKEKLLTAEKAVSGYVDPYTNQIISLYQAMQKDLVQRDYGLRLLEAQIATQGLFDPVEKSNISVESAIQKGFYEKGLLNDQMSELKVYYNPSLQENLNYQNLLDKCTVEPDTGLLLIPVCITFKGLRRGISSTELLESKVIDKKTFDDLQRGNTTTQDVMLMETVKEYLQGKGSIAGIAVLSSNQRMSIYEAMKKGVLMPGTALVLLEAQASTGFMIDPVENKKFTVDEAIKNKLVGPEYHAKLRSAERAVIGYKDPFTGETISLFQALSKDLIVKEHGIRLLEAQIATGGIIDPINSHRLPTDVAFRRGYFDQEMKAILEESGDDTKGFFDPNTEDNLTYLQLMQRCVIDPNTGLCLLPLHDKSDRLNFNFIEYDTKMAFKEEKVNVTCGKYMGMTVSLWELLMSEYFDESQRRDIIQKYREGKLNIKMIITTVLEVIEKSVKTTNVIFEGIRETVTAKQLVDADIISKEVMEDLKKGKMSVKEVIEDENVNVYLQGKGSIAGILLPDSRILTIYQARQKGNLMPGTALILLEAQAATGFIVDPIGNRKFSVDDAVKAKIVGPDLCQKLRSAEKAVTGYKNPYDGQIISLFQAMQNDLILKDHGIRLLEAQIATGGIIDPVNSHRIPVHVAYKKGYFNEEMNEILRDPSDDTKGFFDPNTHENLTYLQLMARCVKDPSTGLCLLPLKSKSSRINIDDNLRETFKTTTVTVKYGRFKGKHTTLWDLINSEYVTEDKRQEFFKLFKSRKITIEQLIVTILEIIENKEIKQQAGLSFAGLRGEVSVVDLFQLKIVDEKTYNSLVVGKMTSEDVMKMESVRNYLQGIGCVAGVILQPSNQKLSIYEAQRIGILTPGTALCLLEAQAATGFIVDPLKNKKLTVEQALREKVVGPQMHEKLLSAERAVTGYRDPYTGEKISLFQALQKDLIVKQHAIRLLEAQIATGGIIDPLKCLHLPLEVAYRKGYFDAELNQILSDPTDDTKGFFDPKTQDNLTYMEMMGRCVKDKETGLFLLPLNDKPTATGTKANMYTNTEIKQEFEKTAVSLSVASYAGKSVSLWDLIHSGYFTEDQQLEFLENYRTRKITTQTIITIVISTIEKLENETPKMIRGLRKPVSAQQLLDADIIDADTFKQVKEGKLTLEALIQREPLRGYLRGTGSIAGIKVHPSQKIMSIYDAKKEDLLTPGIALLLLEAQAATGWIIDPLKNKLYDVDEAAREKVIGPDVHEQLLSAERAVTGYKDPYTDATISLFEAMVEQLIQRSDGIRLLETQIATGGVIDPNQSHRLPIHVAVKKGYLDEEIRKTLLDPTGDAKGFFDPNNKENLSYLQLIKRCEKDPETGLLLLPLYQEKSQEFHTDEQIELAFKNKTIAMNAGKFKDKKVTLWEVLLSEYISEQKREQLIQQYKTGAMKMEEIIEILTVIITEVSSKERKFKGLRKQVSASELYESKIISKELFRQIIQGDVTEDNVNQMESIQKYLGATNCIAGVRVESTKKVMSIYEAKTKSLLTPGTSLVLLEAQAATGFVIDPVNNKKLSVEEAVAQGVVGSEWKKKLLSAERAVTGYKDPYTGDTISLFQALKKDLIVKDHGIRLLEAQIATGGIIDPVYSHRVPVQVAYQRCYFDEEMNQILSDPDDDTKGFFDPNTQENLTYLQLVERCITDPITGLSLLVIAKKGEFYFFVDEATKLILKSTTTTRAGGKYQGTTVSLWDLLYSKYISEEKRREFVQQYKSGSITIERFLELILTIIQQQTTTTTKTITTTTVTETKEVESFHGIRKDVTATELLESKIINEDLYKNLTAGNVTVSEVSEMESVRKYLEGTNSIAGVYLQSTKQTLSIYEAKSKTLLTPGTSLVLLEAQAATGFVIDPVKNKKLSVEDAVAQGLVGSEWKNKLLSAERAVTGYKDPYTGHTISLFQALKKDLIVKDHGIRLLEAQIATGGIIDPVYSHRVPVQVAYQRCYFDEEMNQILSDPDDDTKGFFDPNTQENLTYLQLVERCITDPITGLSLLVIAKKGEFYFFVDEATKLILKSTTTTRAGGKYQGTTVSLWDLLYSKYISEEKRREFVQQYKSGSITIERFLELILTIIQQQTTTTTKTITTTTVTETNEVESFHGIRKDVTATELLESKIINEDLYKNLTAGNVTVSEVSEMESVRKYLEGTNSIAGVYLQSTKQTLSIYEAKSKTLLTPGTSLVLLEAQAATGFVIDPVKNKKLSVEDAVAQGLVGSEWKNKLLSAERAVTGYKDPYTGHTISLFQALKKDLIVKDHGIRLLEAQIATGGIIDPVYSHRVPVQVAYQRCYFDEEMNQILSDPDDDTKGFFDPNTQENLTYLQLVERCITDPITGLSLLVIAKKGEFYFFVDEATKLILKSTTTTRAGGKYQGTTVSLWDLLYSKYISEEKRREFVQQYKSGSITIERFLELILTIIQQQTTTTTKTITTTTVTETNEVESFHGIRKDVTATELLESKIINEDLYKNLTAGNVTVSEVSEMESVRKYLEGTNSIAGVYLQSTKQTLSIYEAKSKTLLTPGTSLVLLEAQAATGFVIDPVKNKKLSVEDAVAQGLVGSEWKNKLLSAERAVTGYKDPYTGHTISLFQALKKDLIVKDHGIRLLEAQIATGGIIDPVYSHRVPVQVAYQRCYFDEEMNQILSDPDDDTKGFFDPNTQENLTYLQLVERCITDPITGLSLLVIAKKGEFYFFVDEATKLILKSTTTTRAGGKYQGTTVSLWDLLYSKYISEEKRREFVQQYKSGSITIERFLELILTIIQQQTTTTTKTITTTTVTETNEVESFHGIRKDVTATELLESKIINEDLYKNLTAGNVTVSEVSEMESVRKYLEGTNSIAGVYLQSTKQTLSIYEAKSKTLLTPGTSLVLLEAQAATGFVIDPVKNKKLSVEDAVAQGLVGSEWKNKLLSAERAVTGYKDPYTGHTISLFQALKKDLIVKDHGIRLLEAQIATGGIIDPVYSHRVPVQVAYQRCYFDEEMNQILSDPDDDTKGFFDPNTQENLTYLQLVERCITDPITGLSLLVIAKKGEFYFFVDEATKLILKSTTTTRAGGKYQGTTVSLWDLLYSKYISEEKRREFVQQYKSGSITIERFLELILTIIQQQTTTTTKTITTTTVTETNEVESFHGIRKDVTATELLESKIINEDLYKNLTAGNVTVSEVSEMESVRKYLEGTNSIAGVYLQSTKQTLSIYEAKSKTLLTPGTSLVLLEAQAATGFVIDPVKNKKLSVEDAVAQGLVGSEWKNKLLSAERAVTGYKDPYTGHTISLFQALKKDLIVKDHGIRLLEAQIATGGIIDPVYSHRVPVQVAYQRCYFDEEMNQILSDPDDDTKGFFDPNTQENLTYLQLVERCITDPITGLSLLVIAKKGEFYFFVDEATKLILKSTTTTRAGGKYQGTTVSLWDLLYSKYISEEKRREFVQQYKSGSITIERFLELILTIIQQQTTTTTKTITTTTVTETNEVESFHGIRKDVTATELLESKIINEDLYKNLTAGNVTVSEVSEMESVRKYLEGTNSIAGVYLQSTKQTLSIYEAKSKTLLTPGTSLVLLEAQAATGFVIDPVKNKKLSVEDAVAQGLVGSEWKNKLLSAERAVTGYKDPYTGHTISLFQALKKDLIVKDHGIRLLEAQIATGGIIDPVYSHRVPVQVAYQRCYFDEEMNQILSDPDDDTKGFFDPNTQENLTYLQLVERCITDPITGLSLLVIAKKGEFYFFVDEATKLILKSTTTTRAGGKYQGTTVSLWDLLYSKYISEEKRREFVQQYKSGSITIERFLELILTIIQQQTTTTTKTITTTTVTETNEVESFHGIRKDVTATELLESKIINEDLYKNLTAGNVTVSEVSEMESVRKYLEGTNSIAGVYLQSTKQTLSIYEAKSKTLLTPGTSLVLLEAQAATGFVIDPVKNKKLSVEDAVAQGLVGSEWKNKLLSAERAVTGYKDPYTGHTISLFQALKKDLIVKDHGIRLLEAQIATGGIIDPVYSHRVPVQVAYQRCYFDEEMNQILSDPDDDTKGFFDPNTQENLTYLQLVERCITDPITGLSLLVIAKKGEFYFFVDEATKLILKSTTTTRAGGKYQGTTVSLWDLLYSKYISEEKRREFVQQYKSGSITIERFLELILTIIQQQTTTTTKTITTTTVTETNEVESFHGIRKDVTATELLESKIINEDLYKNLTAGNVTVSEVSEMESVRKYLEGTNSIAGVYLQSTKQTLSIYEAKSKTLLTPGTSLVLLEAQAATGFVIDPVKNKKLSVEDAVAQGLVGSEWKNKLLSAERAVTGYKDPYTGHTISLFQALKKDLIVKDHGIRLLEAQIATGGIIDPVYSHRVPVQVAYQRCYFDEEMNQILSDPDDDTKGFFDPNTQENLTYLQLVERCITDPITGLSLLVIAKKGEFYFFVDEATKLILKSTTTTRAGGKYQGTTVSLWDLLYSKYISEEKRREFVQQYKSGSITIERFLELILTIIQQQTTTTTKTITTTTVTETNEVESFHGIRKDVTATELLESKIINEDLYKNLTAGNVTVSEVSEMESVRKYLEGTNSIAGVYLQSTKQTLSIYEAKSKTLLTPGTSLVLLEAQAATGFVIDPVKNKKLSVEDAVAQGLVGSEWKNKLLSAERAVTGYKDPYTGHTISLFQALKKDLIVKDHGIRLLEAQIATGGIIDPVYSHRVPVQVAYQRCYFDEEMNQILSDPDDDTKGFFDPNTQENLTYLQLVERCITDPITGLSLLVIAKKGEFYFFVDEATKLILKSTTTTRAGGKYQGTTVSLWDLLYSKYISEEKRREFVQQYKSGSITIERFLELILTIIQQQTTTTTKTITTTTVTETNEVESFHGIRKDVTATELLESKIINEDLYKNLTAGNVTVSEVSEMESVRKYLEGTNSIAGVYLQSTKQTLSIYEAKSKTLLTPGTSLVLLEAQAATGFVIDPVKNKKLSVEDAVAQGLVGSEWKNKLLSAERAVTGYKDPYTGHTISLFQALKKDLIVKDHGIRLLEAQIATGGIIDPVYSHRVPVQVAYQRCYFDEEMNQILSDPDDDTKGFFDPNTQENLTYLQLVERCITDPITGLSLLVIAKKGEFYFFVDEATKLILKSTTTTRAGGKYQGTTVSLWDLLYSKYISEEKRREFVQQYKSGSITIERFLELILTIIQQQTTTSTKTITTTTVTETNEVESFHGIRKDVTATELLESKIINEDLYKNLTAGNVTVSEVSEMESVRKYLEGTNSIAGVYLQSTKQTLSIYEAKSKTLLTPGTSLVLLEAQAATGFVIDPVKNKKLSVEDAVAQGLVGSEWKNKLLSAERAVTGYKDPYTGHTISLFQALKKDLIVKDHGIRLLEAQIATGGIIDPVYSHRVPVQVAYQRCYFDEEMNQILSDPDDDTKGFFDPNTQENLTYLQLVERCITDPITGLSLLVIAKKGEFYFFVDEATKLILKSTTTTRAGGKYQGTTVSLWDLLYSKYISEEKRREFVQQYKSGSITIERFLELILTIIQQQTTTTIISSSSIVMCQPPETKVDSSTTKTITTTTVTETNEVESFHGIRKDVTATELLESKIINEDLYKNLTAGNVTVSEVSEMESVRKYLEGTNSIAGVYLQSTKQTLSIYEAKSKTLLTPGTSLVLLEAQAATGFVIDPVKNKKLSVEDAVAQGLVGSEWKNKLLSAERAVTGYKDPYTGHTISLFQALKKDLIVKDHGIRLLEAQIATGGIIDPVYSHRVPVQVAYQRCYFDEEMNQILSDPDDDTKGFFDPNTQENLTYLQLVERCITDPITGLSLLVIAKKGEFYFFVDEATKLILKSTTTTRAGGKYQGTTVSLWDLLYSKYVSEEKRREFVQQYKSGSITIERFLELILTIIQQQTSAA